MEKMIEAVNVSYIYQAFHLFPLLTVLENVMFPMQLKHVPVKEAKARALIC